MDHGYAVKTIDAEEGLTELLGPDTTADLVAEGLVDEKVQKELLAAIAADCLTKRTGGK